MKTLTASELAKLTIVEDNTRSRYNWQLLGNGQTHILTIGEDIPENVKGWKGTAATALRELDPPVRPVWGKIPNNDQVITMRCEPIELPSTFIPDAIPVAKERKQRDTKKTTTTRKRK